MRRFLLCFIVLASFGVPVLANPAAIKALNDLRASKGVAPVVYSTKLEAAAQAHALAILPMRGATGQVSETELENSATNGVLLRKTSLRGSAI